ncbi:MAG: hypothetical protein ABIQ60_17095 [Burkholderiaceae bacterium]
MSKSRSKAILAMACKQETLVIEGPYTRPRSWGVYVVTSEKPTATKLHRIGNHPVRERELRREFPVVQQVALFTARALAEELAALYNAGEVPNENRNTAAREE